MSRLVKVLTGQASEDEAADVGKAFSMYLPKAFPGTLDRQPPVTALTVGLAAGGGDTPVKAVTGERESGRDEVLSVRIKELSTRIGYFLTFVGIIVTIFIVAFLYSFGGVNQRIDDVKNDVNQRIDNLKNDVNQRIDKVEAKLETLDGRVSQMREDIVRLQSSMDLLLRASGLHLEPAKPSNEPAGRASPGESAPPTAEPTVP
jgi:hypothetical protein